MPEFYMVYGIKNQTVLHTEPSSQLFSLTHANYLCWNKIFRKSFPVHLQELKKKKKRKHFESQKQQSSHLQSYSYRKTYEVYYKESLFSNSIFDWVEASIGSQYPHILGWNLHS